MRMPIDLEVPRAKGEPQQRSLRGVLRASFEDQGDAYLVALNKDLDSTGLSNGDIAERVGIDKAQLCRVRQGEANAPGKLIAWAIENGRDRFYVREVCRSAEGEFKPKPPPAAEEKLAAYLEELAASGLADHFAAKVAARLEGKP